MSSFNLNNRPQNIPQLLQWCVQGILILFGRTSSSSGGGGGTPSGPAGGDLTGTYPDPTIKTSVALSGSPTTTTQAANDNSTKIATTAYADAVVTNQGITVDTTPITGGGSGRMLFQSTTGKVSESANITFDLFKLLITGGAVQWINTNALGATTGSALKIQNSTAGTTGKGGVLQSSPALEFLGSAQNGLSLSNGFRMYYFAQIGGGTFQIDYSADGTTYTNLININSGGNFTTTVGSISSASTVSANTALGAGTTVSAGTTVTAGTGVIATTGDITATNGNIIITAINKSLDVLSSNVGGSVAGTATLVAGTVTIGTTAVAAGDVIMVTLNTPGGTLGLSYSVPSAGRVVGGGFVINSVDSTGAVVVLDTSTVDWFIIHTH